MYDAPTDWLDDSARDAPAASPSRPDRARLSYAELRGARRGLASVLGDLGVGPGRSRRIELEPGVAHAVALHGAILAGAVASRCRRPVATGPRTRRALVDVATIERAAAATQRGTRLADAAPAGPRPADAVLERGTSGRAEAGRADRSATTSGARWRSAATSASSRRRWLGCLPMDHVGGLSILIRSAIYGTAALIHPRLRRRRRRGGARRRARSPSSRSSRPSCAACSTPAPRSSARACR